MRFAGTSMDSGMYLTDVARAEASAESSFRRLSTGQRVTDASDDAAGLAIATTMNTKISAARFSIRNLSSAVSMLNVGESGLAQVSNVLKRMREISLRASNNDLTTNDRSAISREMTGLVSEVDRTVNSSSWRSSSPIGSSSAGGGSATIAFSGSPSASGTSTIVAETFTLTAINATTFSVVGSVSGAHSNATTGTAYTSNAGTGGAGAGLQFTLTAGAYTAGQSATITAAVSGSATIAASATSGAVAGTIKALRSADFNGDGFADIAFVDNGTANIKVMLNNGAGAFGAASTFSDAGTTLRGLAVGDVDGDGDVDIVASSNAGNTMTTFSNNGSGSFTAASTAIGTAVGTAIPILVDVDGDGDKDYVTGSSSGQVGVMKNNGAGAFGAISLYTAGAGPGSDAMMSAGDVDADGDQDLIGNSYAGGGGASHQVWVNDGTGAYSSTQALGQGHSGTYDSNFADVDGDGDLDALGGGADGTCMWRNNGAGSFSWLGQTVGGVGTSSGDLDADGDVDIVAGHPWATGIAVAINNGAGSFSVGGPTLDSAGVGSDGDSILVDLNKDGGLDVVGAAGGNRIATWNGGTTKTLTDSTGAGAGASSGTTFTFEIGVSSSETLSVAAVDASASGLGVSGVDLSSQSGAQSALAVLDTALNSINSMRSSLGGAINRAAAIHRSLTDQVTGLSSASSKFTDADFAVETANNAAAEVRKRSAVSVLGMVQLSNKRVLDLLLRLG